MKRNLILYLLLGFCVVFFTAFAVLGFLKDVPVAGAVCILMAAVTFLYVIATFAHEKVNLKCKKLFEERNFGQERQYLEKQMKSPFFFIVRIAVLQHYVLACAALDDLATSKRYIDVLRHGGGKGWKYRTAYLYILIQLDEGNIQTARAEYDDFRRDCLHAKVYQGQLEVLQSIFARLFSLRNTAPLPKAAVGSSFPVVNRILGRHYEQQASSEDWYS